MFFPEDNVEWSGECGERRVVTQIEQNNYGLWLVSVRTLDLA